MTDSEIDEKLLKIYIIGFNDELYSRIQNEEYDSSFAQNAYQLGRDHAIIGDEVSSIDLLSGEELLKMIKK